MTKAIKKVNTEALKLFNKYGYDMKLIVNEDQENIYICLEGYRAYKIPKMLTPFRSPEHQSDNRIIDIMRLAKNDAKIEGVVTAEKKDIDKATVIKIQAVNDPDIYCWINEKFIKGYELTNIMLRPKETERSPIYCSIGKGEAVILPVRVKE